MIVVSKKQVKKYLPIRSKYSNKSDYGKTLIVGGSRSMPGAAILSARAAARSGSGYTYLLIDYNSEKLFKNPDFIIISKSDFEKKIKTFSSFALGPGISSRAKAKKFLNSMLKHNISSAVIDAGALSVLRDFNKKIKLPSTWILTPHEGEMSALLNKSSQWVKKNRIEAVKAAFKKYGCCILLKGHQTLIYDGRKIYCVKEGTSALAKAGTGDVLTGIIAALLSQKLSSTQAAITAAYVHGYAAQLWEKSGHDKISLMASDLIELLPIAFSKIR